jgi:hypothetical protein
LANNYFIDVIKSAIEVIKGMDILKFIKIKKKLAEHKVIKISQFLKELINISDSNENIDLIENKIENFYNNINRNLEIENELLKEKEDFQNISSKVINVFKLIFIILIAVNSIQYDAVVR